MADDSRQTAHDDDDTAFDDNAFATRGGVYFPSDHAVLAISDRGAAERLANRLRDDGLNPLLVTPERMARFLGPTFDNASTSARIVGAELKQTEILLQHAQAGCTFLIVGIDGDKHRDRLYDLAEADATPVAKGLYFHTLVIEELKLGREQIPGDSPYGMNEVPRAKGTDAHNTGLPTPGVPR